MNLMFLSDVPTWIFVFTVDGEEHIGIRAGITHVASEDMHLVGEFYSRKMFER